MQEFYRAQANQIFKPNAINNPDDEEYLIAHCKALMNENNIPLSEDEDEWLEFVYRAIELIELNEKGYCYSGVRVNGELVYNLEVVDYD